MTRVIVTDHVFESLDATREVLEPMGVEVVLAAQPDEDALVELCSEGVDGLLVCFAQVGGRVVQAAADAGCRIIARYGIGYDNVAVDTATANGIVVTRVPDYCLDEVADHALALMLSAARGVSAGQREVRDGGWTMPREVFRLRGRRLALIGVGQIGSRLAQRALVIGLEVVGFDPYLESWPAGVARADSLDEALAEADIVSLHVPLTDENRGLIGERAISAMHQQRRAAGSSTSRPRPPRSTTGGSRAWPSTWSTPSRCRPTILCGPTRARSSRHTWRSSPSRPSRSSSAGPRVRWPTP
jgi:D-3-phosphoglycerate dehydrogenase / 2-oxoglutarate reductase